MHVEVTTDVVQGYADDARKGEQGIVDSIRTITGKLLQSKEEFLQFHLNMRELERTLLKSEDKDELLKHVMLHFTQDDLQMLNDLYCEWETRLERRFVNFLDLGVVKHYLDYPLYARFERLISREVYLLRDRKPERVLFIGSGPMPVTALCMHHHLGVRIDCLEHNLNAVEESRVVIEKLGMSDAIHVIHGQGQEVNASLYDVIVVALLAKPKRKILESIAKTCSKDIRVVCRTSDGSRQVFYEPTVADAIPDSFYAVEHAKAGVDDTISSVLLKRALSS
ncbi:MAG: hypothetical protein OEZ43_06780 [Gammaproteobacteria bacterium]|nr:hypothetical protein [Gammaproteobacteria bacterium]